MRKKPNLKTDTEFFQEVAWVWLDKLLEALTLSRHHPEVINYVLRCVKVRYVLSCL